jgi:hypothetical protein
MGNSIVRFSGAPEAVQQAQQLIQDVLNNVRKKGDDL